MIKKRGAVVIISREVKITSAIILVLSGFISIGLYFDKKDNSNVTLEFKTNVLEYGEEVDFNDLLVTEGIDIKSTECDSYRLGSQEVSMIYEYNKKTIIDNYEFTVKDTNNPIIDIKEDEINLEYGKEYKLSDNVKKCSDKIDGELEYVIEGEVDNKKVGTYTIKVSATDKNENTTTKEFKIIVNEEKEETNNSNTTSSQNTMYTNTSTNNSTSITSNIPAGKTIYVDTKYAAIPDSVLQGNLSDSDYTFINEVFDILRTSNEDVVMVNSFLTMRSYDEMMSFISYISSLIGSELHYRSIYPCAENGVSYADESMNKYYRVRISPLDTKEYINKTNVLKGYAINALNQAGVYSGMNERDAINRINNWICSEMSYVITNDSDVYSGFYRGIGQCYHYSNMFKLLCKYIGIECDTVYGYANGGAHSWNKAVINGQTYYFDITWNDYYGDSRYSWLTESQLKQTHSW